jgi:spore maturation protein CgeB
VFYYLYWVPESMGHDVTFFDYWTAARIDRPKMRRVFLDLLRSGGYDAAFVATVEDEFDVATLEEAKQLTTTIAWNSDDEWRWDDYSRQYAPAYTWMVTNDPDVYERNREDLPNLIHAQWACTGRWNGRGQPKDIPFSFVGRVFGSRADQIRALRRRAGLVSFGSGTGRRPEDVDRPASWKGRVRTLLAPLATRLVRGQRDDVLDFEAVNSIWNRSRISFTPTDSVDGSTRQIKSRIFDMGLSGTLMLAHDTPRLSDYYRPGKEYVPFDSVEECAALAEYYLRHESERQRITDAYATRTLSDHMWHQRIHHVLSTAGLG